MTKIDFSDTIIAKSDQLNAGDISGSLTIKIVEGKKKSGDDQPIALFYEGDTKRPWKPCKSMRRVIAQLWGGKDGKVDVRGKLVTLFCDPSVTWGGESVGGIRISHMSGIDKAINVTVRASRHNVKTYSIKPLKETADISEPLPPAPDKELLGAGVDAAEQGVDAYKEWLSTLSDDEKTSIKPKHKELSKLAKESEENEGLPAFE